MAGGSLKSIIGTIRKKPSKAPDRKSDSEANGGVNGEKTSVLHDLTHLNFRNAATVAEAITTLASGDPMDDKELLLEHGVSMLQTLPLNSGLADKVSKDFIQMLWHDLPHPAATVAGPTARYRQADGSGNNPWNPEMGKAFSPYARNVPPLKPKGPNLPDPELVYEQLMKRDSKAPFRKHPSGLNRLFFSFATIVIHECFQTNRQNPWINETSSYVDLSTLYGNTEKEQKRVRTYQNGKIWPDSVASERIMMMPPGVIAVLIMFSRNHNEIAQNLLSVNEGGWYQPWESLDEEKQKKQDEDLFQLARNINVGFFATVVLKDYVAAILNTPRANSTWSLDLGCEIKNGGSRVERGTGNVVSVEFAVLYHWHAALSKADDWWMQDQIKHVFPHVESMDDLTPEMFMKVVMVQAAPLIGPNAKPAKEWTFNGLERGPDGRFDDVQLAELIKDCIEEPAHEFGAHGTPASLRMVDIMGMKQAREAFNVCTMNEFRKYLNLLPYKTFEDWNPDKQTARAAELLYGHIDNLELYPGLMGECTKPAMPGSGVCPGQTTGRGILDDAVALVRGDRFLSYDMNSNTLTNWGVGKLGALPGGSYGGMLPHLLFTGLPYSFSGISPYVLLPFYTPEAARGILKGNKAIENYDLDRSPSDSTIASIVTYDACKKILADRENFRVIYKDPIREVSGGKEFMVAWDEQKKHDDRRKILEKAFFEEDFEENVTKFFSEAIQKLVKDCSLKYQGPRRAIDIVRDVTNVVPILWLAHKFAIPLKTWEQPRGLLSIPEVFDSLLAIFEYTAFNIRPANEWALRDGARKGSETLSGIFEGHLKTQTGHGIKEKIVDRLEKGTAFEVGPEADRLYHALNESGLSVDELVADCIGIAAPVAGNLSQQASLLVDLFMHPGYEAYKERITELAQRDDAASQKELEGFVLEGMRHASFMPGVPRVSATSTSLDDGDDGPKAIKAHQTVLVSISKANMDPTAFPDPKKIDPNRPRDAYLTMGYGMHQCFGSRLVLTGLTAIMKGVFKLKGIKPSGGKLGKLSFVEHDVAGVKMRTYLDHNSRECSVPTTLTLDYVL